MNVLLNVVNPTFHVYVRLRKANFTFSLFNSTESNTIYDKMNSAHNIHTNILISLKIIMQLLRNLQELLNISEWVICYNFCVYITIR